MSDSRALVEKYIQSPASLLSWEVDVLNKIMKGVFFGSGFMRWVRRYQWQDVEKRAKIKANNVMLEKVGVASDDEFVEALFSSYCLTYQTEHSLLFAKLPTLFLQFDKVFQDERLNQAVAQIKKALRSDNLAIRTSVGMLLGKYAEASISQARKALAGESSVKTMEMLFKSIGWEEGNEFGRDFMYQNDITDFTIPSVRDWHAYDVQAYIAVQSSTNDRAKLTSSSLHAGANRYLCSFNGCHASSKSTKDISDSIARSFREKEIYYVVIERERQEAIADAKERMRRHKGTKKGINAQKRLDWLLQYTINYSDFLSQIRGMNVSLADPSMKPKSRTRK